MTAGHDLHLDEGTLVRWLDDELSVDERAAVEDHLADCPACREERESLAALSGAFGRWAGWAEPAEGPPEVAPPVAEPRSEPGRVVGGILRAPAFRAAAVLVLLAGVALAVGPASRWVEERTGTPTADPEAPAAPADAVPGSMSVSFLPEGDGVSIRVARSQAGGSIRVTRGAGPEVEARVIGGDGGEELTVLPDGVAVVNPGDSSADYAVAVPATLREVVLVVAGRRIWSGAPDALPIERTLSAGADAPAGEGAER